MTSAELTKPSVKSRRLWTYDEMLAEPPESNQSVELWNGEITMSPASHPAHQEVVFNFAQALSRFVVKGRFGKVYVGPVDVVLTQRRVVQPDVIFIRKSRLSIVTDRIGGVPDLAMEVVSERTRQRDRIHKKALYEQASLPEYWIIDPESETIEVFTLLKGVYELNCRAVGSEPAKSKLLPGFKTSFRQLVG